MRADLEGRLMKNRVNIPLATLIVVLILVAVAFYRIVSVESAGLKAVKGFLNCSSIDNRNPVLLRGEWEYYENHVLFPSDFNYGGTAKNGSKPQYVQVPGDAPNAYGFGTYRLTFRAVTSSETFALKTTDVWSSARIYLDGKLICQIGDPSTLSNASLPWNSSLYVTFAMDTFRTNHELIIQTSNYDFYRQGIANPIHFGTQIKVYELSNNVRLSESICAMSVFILAVLLLCLLTLRIQFGSILHLLLFSVFFGLYLMTTGEKLLLNLFPDTPYLFFTRLYLITMPLMSLFMALYVCAFGESGRGWIKVRNTIVGASAVLVVALAFAPQKALALLVAASQIQSALLAVVCLWFLIKRLWLRDTGALFQALAWLNWLMVFGIGVLYARGMLTTSTHTLALSMMVVGFVILQLIYVAQRVSHIYSGNERLAQRMVISDRLKNDLMAIVSHELRTPLHGIINITQSVVEDIRSESGVESTPRIDELGLALRLARRMSGVVGDLYNFAAEGAAGGASYPPTSLRVVVNAVMEMFNYTQSGSPVHLVNLIRPGASAVYADENKLWQVLSNLVGNSLKYTKSGTVTVSSRRESGMVHVMVTDTGIGISKEAKERIFERYTRLASGEAVAPGAGLGLYIARKLVEEMHGQIRVEWSEPDKGSCIAFTLPACDERELTEQTGRVARRGQEEQNLPQLLPVRPASGRLLVADDNPTNLEVFSKIFADCNFQIDAVTDGQQALDHVHLAGGAYDIVILDVMMPGMSGFEACRLMRAQYSHAELPILMLTARNLTRDIVTGFWAGANDYVAKPADALELRARVFTLIRLHQTASEAIENEMAFLQAQIKPHFLYNAFNTISAIALTDGVAASELIDDLGVYLRSSFQARENGELVPLARELETTEAFLRIQKARFGNRLNVEMDITTTVNYPVPPLILQPLVENAVRHGSMGKTGGITVRIRTAIEGEALVICVSDDGAGMDDRQISDLLKEVPGEERSGIGLFNVSRRLRLRYNCSLDIKSAPGEGTTITIRIPLTSLAPSPR